MFFIVREHWSVLTAGGWKHTHTHTHTHAHTHTHTHTRGGTLYTPALRSSAHSSQTPVRFLHLRCSVDTQRGQTERRDVQLSASSGAHLHQSVPPKLLSTIRSGTKASVFTV